MGKTPKIYVWDTSSGSPVIISCMKGFHMRSILAVTFSSDGEKLGSVGNDDDHSIAIYKWKDGTLLASSKGERSMVNFACFFFKHDYLIYHI